MVIKLKWSEIVCCGCGSPSKFCAIAIQREPNGNVYNYCLECFKVSPDKHSHNVVCLLCHKAERKFMVHTNKANQVKYICKECYKDEEKEDFPFEYDVGKNNINSVD